MSKQLLLWGDTQAGKSTLLTTAIFSEELRGLIDLGKSGSSLVSSGIMGAYRSLQENRFPMATNEAVDVRLERSTEPFAPVSIRDIVGGKAREFLVWEEIDKADGVLFVVEWEGPTFSDQMRTVERAVEFVKSKTSLFGMAITKCEKALREDDPTWTARWGDSCWDRHSCWKHFSETMKQMGDRIWVTSSFGYHMSRPAALLGEFGDWIPYNIRPVNVGRPFTWFLREFEKC